MNSQLQVTAIWLSRFVPNRSFLMSVGGVGSVDDAHEHYVGVVHVQPSRQVQKLPRGAELMCAHARGRVLLTQPIDMDLLPDSEVASVAPYFVSWYDCYSGHATKVDVAVFLASMPVWSDSGDQLACIGWPRKSSDKAQLLCTNIASGVTSTIAHDWGNFGSFRWLHHDSQIVAVKSNPEGLTIKHFNLAGELLASQNLAVGMTRFLDLSPAGTHVAFVEDPGWFDLRLHVLSLAGESKVIQSRIAVEPNLIWSSDGSRVLYYAFDTADKMRLYAFDIWRGEELLSLVIETDDDVGEIPRNAPCFLDENRFIAVSVYRDESDELIVADLQTQKVEKLQTGIRVDKIFVVNELNGHPRPAHPAAVL